jgi:acetyl esterase/lipase
MLPTQTFPAWLPQSTTNAAPMLHYYAPTGDRVSGHVLVIFPGGGYAHRAEHEGPLTARWFAAHGIASFVVEYRTCTDGARHPAMLEDGLAAIHTVREKAPEYGYHPHQLGVLGYSAGGHLAAHCLTAFADRPGSIDLRPDFGLLAYPVIHTQPPFSHEGSMRNLLGGDNPGTEARQSVDILSRVNQHTPPTFLWHTVQDTGVPPENSIDFAIALRRAAVPFELHCYETGRHGLGPFTEHAWMEAAVAFIRRR